MSIKQNDMYETKDNNIANETNNEENDIKTFIKLIVDILVVFQYILLMVINILLIFRKKYSKTNSY